LAEFACRHRRPASRRRVELLDDLLQDLVAAHQGSEPHAPTVTLVMAAVRDSHRV
jgi:hypothetical protein